MQYHGDGHHATQPLWSITQFIGDPYDNIMLCLEHACLHVIIRNDCALNIYTTTGEASHTI